MKKMLKDVWKRDPKGFLSILLLNIAVSMTGGVSIVMLIPMLGLLDISQASVSALAVFTAPLQRLPYAAQISLMIGLYFVLVVLKALLGRALSLRQNRLTCATSCIKRCWAQTGKSWRRAGSPIRSICLLRSAVR